MRLLLVILAVALQAAVLGSLAQETKRSDETYTMPDEHKEFVDQFNSLLKKFPEAAKHFKLGYVRNPPVERHVIFWKCTEFPIGSGFESCEPQPPE